MKESLNPRFNLYDEDGNRRSRISVQNEANLYDSAGEKISIDELVGVPAFYTPEKSVDVDDLQRVPATLPQSVARRDYETAEKQSTDDWEFVCPLFRRPVSQVAPDRADGAVKRTQWIVSPRGSYDSDEHIYTSTLAAFGLRGFVPKWASEHIAHHIGDGQVDEGGLDGHAQLGVYWLMNRERELADAADYEWNDEDFYRFIADKYRTKFTPEELRYLDLHVEKKLNENYETVEAFYDEFRQEWARVLGGKLVVNSSKTYSMDDDQKTTFFSYSNSVEGDNLDFESVDEATEWIESLMTQFDEAWEETLEMARNGEISVTSTEAVSHPIDELPNPHTTTPDTQTNGLMADGGTELVVYREWMEADNIPALNLYCSNCGSKVWEDTGNAHAYDSSLRMDCHDCGTALNQYALVTTPRARYDFDEIPTGEKIETALKTYWNRAMRYGYRLGDRIAVDVRAAEFHEHTRRLNFEWGLECSMFRKEIGSFENEGLHDVEFNHTAYEDDTGASIQQMAQGFTLSRPAHDLIHNNVQGWYLGKHLINDVDADWLQYQAYKTMKVELPVYNAIFNEDADYTDDAFLSHIQTYYDFAEYSTDWLQEAFETVDKDIDTIEATYKDKRDDYSHTYAYINDKGLETADDVAEFMDAKEERIEEMVADLHDRAEAGDLEKNAGDELGLVHPMVDAYGF